MITILCASRSTVYRSFPGLNIFTKLIDVWGAKPRGPVIAHAPCRFWSHMRFSASDNGLTMVREMMLGFHCARLVTLHGGILEQPAHSGLWSAARLPHPLAGIGIGRSFSIALDQSNFGGITTKPTWLYFAGISPKAIQWDLWQLANPARSSLSQCPPGQSNATPRRFAEFLLAAAGTAQPLRGRR